MKIYLVEVSAYAPYPIKKDFRIEASSAATAAARGLRKYRKEVGRKQISKFTVNITALMRKQQHE